MTITFLAPHGWVSAILGPWMNFHYPDFNLPPILLVDDAEDDVFLLRLRLREGGISNPIITCGSSAAALEYLRGIRPGGALPAMLLTDIRMPVESGFALIGAVRENKAWDRIRIAVVTSSNEITDLVRALELGANGYLIKFPPADILSDFVRNGPWFANPQRANASAAVSAPVAVAVSA